MSAVMALDPSAKSPSETLIRSLPVKPENQQTVDENEKIYRE